MYLPIEKLTLTRARTHTHTHTFYVWSCVHLVYNCIINQHDILFFPLYCVTTPLHVSGSFLAHHQDAECIMWRMVLVFLLNWLSAGLARRQSIYWCVQNSTPLVSVLSNLNSDHKICLSCHLVPCAVTRSHNLRISGYFRVYLSLCIRLISVTPTSSL
jgi:hypothetical protein